MFETENVCDKIYLIGWTVRWVLRTCIATGSVLYHSVKSAIMPEPIPLQIMKEYDTERC